MSRGLKYFVNTILVSSLVGICGLIYSTIPDKEYVKPLKYKDAIHQRYDRAIKAAGRSLNIKIPRSTPLERFLLDNKFQSIIKIAGAADVRLQFPVEATDKGNLNIAESFSFNEGQCDVIVSVEVFNEGEILHSFAKHIDNDEMTWRLILGHEAAHCIRNPKKEYDRIVPRAKQTATQTTAAAYLNEAYADNYSLIDIAVEDYQKFEIYANLVKEYRHRTLSSPSWQTAPSIEELIKRVSSIGPEIQKYSPPQIDALAWSVALSSLIKQDVSENIGINKFTEIGLINPFQNWSR